MRMYDIIVKKRNGEKLTTEEIKFFVNGVTDGSIPDYQTSALLMSIYFNGMDKREIADLTIAMAHSGDMVDLSPIEGIKVDKHSTGGVGDKTTLVITPIVAACGVKVAKMSGRGLGHTGGTVDKLESFPGLKTEFGMDDFFSIVNKTGIAVIGQSGNLAPADKKLYALRDVTGTVDNIPLIAASIMSKKLASGSDAIVLDVKKGSGAFMKTDELARQLAETMIDIGIAAGRKCDAVISDMDVPLGCAIGNSLEVIEAIDVLSGGGPDDLKEDCLLLASKMLHLAGKGSIEECRILALQKIENGEAKKKFAEMVEAQGGDPSFVFDTEKFQKAKYSRSVIASKDGTISKMDTEKIGIASVILGAGRATKESLIDYAAGIKIYAKTGDNVKKGQELAVLFADDEKLFEGASNTYLEALVISE